MSPTMLANSFLIAGRALNGVIGHRGSIPWHATDDLAHFKTLTIGTAMIMGRGTWDSLPGALPGRTSIVITSRPLPHPKAIAATSLDDAIALACDANAAAISFIGGARIYAEALSLDWLQQAFITTVHLEPEGDTFMPALGPEWKANRIASSKVGVFPACDFDRFTRRRQS